MIIIKNDRSVFPNNVKVSNQYENETRTIQFDLSDVQFTGNTYLICKYQNNQDFYAPLLLDSNFSIPVETFLSAQAGTYSCVIAISTATIGPNYDFSTDNPLFVSNVFTLTVDANFLTGTSTSWQLTPAAQNYFDQLIALVEKVQSDLDSGAFNGNGIQSITKTGSQGLVDTYQITFTNGTTFDYQVTNGQDGQTPTITIQDGYWYINGVNTGQQAQGEQGEPGKDGTDGVGIQSIQKTSTSGNVDTYTITYTNQTTSTFTVTNGVTPNITIGTVTTLQPTEQATATITGTPENPVLNLGIPQGAQGEPGQGGNDNKLIGTVSKSENPSVSDSYNTELMNLIFYGKSTQVTTTGANIFNPSNNQKGYYTGSEGSPVTLNTNVGWSWEFDLSSGLTGQYTFSLTTTVNVRWRYYVVGSDGLILSLYEDSSANASYNTNTFEMPEGATKVYFSILEITGADQAQLMLNEGSSALPYEIYTGGQPSPSPAYSQDITAIEQVSGLIVDGNIVNWNIEQWNEAQKQVLNPIITNDGLSINCNNLTTTLTPNIFGQYQVNSLKLDTSKTYTASCNLTNPNISIIVRTSGGQITLTSSNKQNALPTGAEYIQQIFISFSQGLTFNDVISFQVSVGNDVPQYEPYTEQPFSFTPPEPLYSTPDGSVADIVNVQSGQYEYNMSGAVVLDGSPDEAWSLYQTFVTPNFTKFTIPIFSNALISNNSSTPPTGIFVNKLKGYSINSLIASTQNYENGFSARNNDNNLYLCLSSSIASTVEELRTWLQSNPITVVYPLATPTTQPIPQETLAILRALKSNNGVTNVICNAPASFDYEQSLQIVIQNIWNAINNNTLSIETKG